MPKSRLRHRRAVRRKHQTKARRQDRLQRLTRAMEYATQVSDAAKVLTEVGFNPVTAAALAPGLVTFSAGNVAKREKLALLVRAGVENQGGN